MVGMAYSVEPSHCFSLFAYLSNSLTVRGKRTWPSCDNLWAMTQAYILTLSCPDRLGLVHAVSGFLLELGANIEEAAQYNDHATGLFFMRVQFACENGELASLKAATATMAEPLQMQ